MSRINSEEGTRGEIEMSYRASANQSRPSSSVVMSRVTGKVPEVSDLKGEEENRGIVRREGLVGWWLSLTAPAWPSHPIPISERERLRKAELTSFSILAIFAFLLALVSNSLADATTAQVVGLMAIFLLIAAILNRTGRTRVAAYLIPSVLTLLIAATVLLGPGGDGKIQLIGLPIFDLFAIPIILVSLTGDRRATWAFAAVTISFVVGDILLEHHELISVTTGAQPTFDEMAYAIQHFGGEWGVMNRHVALLFFAALFGWMGARSVDNAIARADRAEEVARLEHAIAEQKEELEAGIAKILDTHVRVANGDFAARAPLGQEHILWQIAYSLNNLLARLQRGADSEHLLRRTQEEIGRLVWEIQRAKGGQIPIWPPKSGTPLDPLLEEFNAAGRSQNWR
jgi:hypothetical protein